jgi:hypothetical protein
MQVLLAAAGLGDIPASQHQEQSQRHASHGSPTTQAIPGSLDCHDAPPVLGVNRQETFATNDNPTDPLVPYMDSGNTSDTTRSHSGMASEHGLRSSQDATFHFDNDPAASVEPVNSVESNTGQIYSSVEFSQVGSFNSGSEQTTLPWLTFGFDDDPAVLVTEGTATGMAFNFSDDPAALLGINQELAFDFMDDPAALSSLGQGPAFNFNDDPAALLGINQELVFDFNNDAAALQAWTREWPLGGHFELPRNVVADFGCDSRIAVT